MIFPSISQYEAVMLKPKGRFLTLKEVSAVLDDSGEPIFRSNRHSVLFLAEVARERCSIRFFTHPYQSKNHPQLLKNEVCMDCGNYFDVALEPPFSLKYGQNIDTQSEIHENRAIFEHNNRFGFVDGKGELVVEAQYDSVDNFSEGRAVVCAGSMYGLIDAAGGEIIAPTWDELSYDGSALCYVESDGLYGVIDRMGNVVAAPEWDWTGEYCHSMLLVEKNGKYGFLNAKGEIAIPIKYDNATSFEHNGYATVTLQSREYQIDTQENRV